jgi:hypothetical protein
MSSPTARQVTPAFTEPFGPLEQPAQRLFRKRIEDRESGLEMSRSSSHTRIEIPAKNDGDSERF